jgi:hypothetical protein
VLALEPQECPQLPQLFGSLDVTTQVPLQFVWPLGQPQRPLTHWPLAHTLLQAPQLLPSVAVLVHVPLHSVGVPLGHLHEPPWHVSPPEQVLPHAPQLELLVDSLTHDVPQSSSPEATH